ncbi:MAG: hypothetical protein KDD47_16270, partial [Acidobacteria bacterium]|nr:hypothetical protein [Acidobacteriota bacterium]
MRSFVDGMCEWTVAAEDGSPDGATTMALTSASELMENFATGRVIDAKTSSSVVTIRDINGHPITFSVSTDGALFAIVRQPESR